MANEIITDFHPEVSYDPPKSEVKRQKLIECFLTGNRKQYLGKAYAEEQINKLSAEEVDKFCSNYEVKFSGQMAIDFEGKCGSKHAFVPECPFYYLSIAKKFKIKQNSFVHF